MFGKKVESAVNIDPVIVELREHVKELGKTITENLESCKKETSNLKEDHIREVTNLVEDHKKAIERKDVEVDTKISLATKKLTQELADATMAANNAKQKAEILETAFKNLGFDVKDMKAILNKLVDGIVSKNQIQIIGQK